MKRKRIQCLSVCLCLLLAMSPAAAFADASDAPTYPSTEENATQPATQPTTEAAPADPVENTEPSTAPSAETSSGETTEPVDDSEPTDVPALQSHTKPTAVPTDEVQSDTPPEAAKAPAVPAPKAAEVPSSAETKAPAVKKGAAQVTAKAKLSDVGLKVSGGVEGIDWEYQNGTLTLKKNGLTVSGTANDYLNIVTAIAVSAVTFDNLKEAGNGKEISVILNGNQTAVTLKGKNQVNTILGNGISIVGTKNSQLTTEFLMSDSNLNVKDAHINSYVMHSNQDVNIKNSKIISDYLVANRDMNISGKSNITLDPSKDQDLPYSPSCLYTGRDLNVDLSAGGKITAKGFKFDKNTYPGFDFGEIDEVVPFLVGRNMNLSKTSKLFAGEIGSINALGYTFRGIVDANGKPLSSVSIDGKGVALNDSAKSDHSSAVVQTASTKTTAAAKSPQTGDDTSVLMYLYLILMAAGATALISRKKLRKQ